MTTTRGFASILPDIASVSGLQFAGSGSSSLRVKAYIPSGYTRDLTGKRGSYLVPAVLPRHLCLFSRVIWSRLWIAPNAIL